MPHNNFNDVDTSAILVSLLAALWGTIMSFLKRDLRGTTVFNKTLTFIADFMISSGFTMLTFIGLSGYGVNDLLSVAIAGFVGHLGIRSSHLIELIIAEKVGAKQTFDYIKNNKDLK